MGRGGTLGPSDLLGCEAGAGGLLLLGDGNWGWSGIRKLGLLSQGLLIFSLSCFVFFFFYFFFFVLLFSCSVVSDSL